MSTPKETIWELDPHTAAKHAILREYLVAWIPILAKYNKRIIYLDGFAGPGKYKGGEDGSPLIALRAALEHVDRIGEMILAFCEKDKDRLDHLESIVERIDLPDKFRVDYAHSEYEQEINEALDALEEDGLNIAPTFAFIDPFGFSGVPMELNHRILSYPRTEVFVNFAVNPVQRFIEHPNDETRSEIARLIGTDISAEDLATARLPAIRDVYKERLQRVASFVRSFEMYDVQNRPIYDLFFASNHELGYEKMKEAMWSVDTTGGFRFSDATDPSQMVLFSEDPTPQLLDRILNRFDGEEDTVVQEIRDWIIAETAFLPKHMKAALRLGEEQGRFYVYSKKTNQQTRRAGSFPPDAIINFDHQEGQQKTLGF